MRSNICRKFMPFLLALAMVISLLPAVALPAGAFDPPATSYDYAITGTAGSYNVYRSEQGTDSFSSFGTSPYSSLADAVSAVTGAVGSGTTTLYFGATMTGATASTVSDTLDVGSARVDLGSQGTYTLKGILTGSSSNTKCTLEMSGASVIVDGATLTSTSGDHMIYNSGTGSVTVQSGTVTSSSGAAINNVSTGAVTVTGGTVTSSSCSAICNESTGTVTIKGGTVSAQGTFSTILLAPGSGSAGNTVLEITDGSVTNTSTSSTVPTGIQAVAIYNEGCGTVKISGGTVTSGKNGSTIINNLTGDINISGGTISGDVAGVCNNDSGHIYLSSTPSIFGVRADIYTKQPSAIVANNGAGTPAYYSGGVLNVYYDGSITPDTTVAVSGVSENSDKFTCANQGYSLSLSGTDLVIAEDSSVWDGTASAFTVGDGSEGDPYQIATAEQLAYLAKQLNDGVEKYMGTYFKLTDDIVLNDESFSFDSESGIVTVTDGTNTGYLGTGILGSTYNTSTASTAGTWYTSAALTGTLTEGTYSGTLNTWTPIGNLSYRFAGKFDGNSKTVKGVCVNSSASNFQGLFGLADTGSTVQNVVVENSVIIASSCVGGIAGYSKGSITGCSNSGIVIGASNVGGVVGTNTAGMLSYSYNAGNVSGSGGVLGGVVGINSGGTVECCYNMGAVKNTVNGTGVGGVVGNNEYENEVSKSGTITNCYNAGSVTSSSARVGGIVGDNNSSCTVSYCYNVGAVTGSDYYGGVVGINASTAVTFCYYDKQMCPVGGISDNDEENKAEGKSTTEMTSADTYFADWDTVNITSGVDDPFNIWALESGLYPRLTGRIPNEEDYDMEKTDAAYVSASPITLSSDTETVNAVQSSFTVSTANGVGWASSDATVISVDSTTATVKKSGNVTLTATKGAVSRSVDMTSTYVSPIPTVLPTSGSFTDADSDVNQISGTISWTAANPTTNITGYKIYWGSDATTKLAGNTAAVYTVSDATTASQTVAADTALPSGANYFLIYSYNANGESATCLAVPITDSSNVDYTVTNDTDDSSKYKVDGTTYDTLTAALAVCATGGDKDNDGKLTIQFGMNSTSPLVIPQVEKGVTAHPNDLVSATYTGCVSITKDNTITTNIETYGLYIPVGKEAHLSGLTIVKNADIDITNRPLSAVYVLGTLYVEAGTNIETTKTQNCVGVNGSSAKFYMTGGSLSHDATGSGNCVSMISGSGGTISGGTISAAGEKTCAVSLLSGSSLTISGTATITGSATHFAANVINTGGNLTVAGGTISSTSAPNVICASGGTVNMTGGTVECTLNRNDFWVRGINNVGAEVTISGGIISCRNTGTAITYGIQQSYNDKTATVSNTAQIIVEALSGYGVHSISTKTDGNGAVAISGGTIDVTTTNGSAVTNNGTGTVNISGGSINSNSYAIDNISGGAVNISGGTVEATGTNSCINNSKGTVAISETDAGKPAKIISVGTTVTLVKDLSNPSGPSGTIFGKTFHASATAGATITGTINAGKNEINKDNYSSATASATGINSPAVFTAWTSDAALQNTIGTTNDVTISSLKLDEPTPPITDIYIKAIAPVPTTLPTNGSFTDADSDKDQISGSIAWTAASPMTGITGYHIYWGSDATTKLAGNTSVIYDVTSASTASQAVAADTARPAGANYFLVYSYNSGGDSATCLAVRFIDIPYSYSGGSGTETDPYQISTADDLKIFASLVNSGTDYTDTYFKQTANINLNEGVTFTFDADTGLVEVAKQGETAYWLGTGTKGNDSGANTTFDTTASVAGIVYTNQTGTTGSASFELNNWTPIGTDSSVAFTGSFDGGGKTVSGIYINGASANQGLFGCISGSSATVKNVGVVNSYIKGADYVGGVMGLNQGGTVQYCYNAGTVTGGGVVGGVVGLSTGTVQYCYNAGSVTGSNKFVGGVTGNNAGTVQYCYNAGGVTGSTHSGGVAGISTGKVQYCYNAGGVTGSTYSGGVVGFNNEDHMLQYCYYDNEKCSVGGIGSNTVSADAQNSAEGKQTSAMQGDSLKAGSSGEGWTTDHWTFKSGEYPKPGKTEVNNTPPSGGSYVPNTPSKTITVTETSSALFSGSEGTIKAEANVDNAFSNSVEVKVTDTEEDGAGFGLGVDSKVYPFDISLYIKGTDTKTEPKDGYAVKLFLPIPEDLLDVKDQLSIMHKSDDGTVETLNSQLTQINGVWYLVFEAKEFSPYALVVKDIDTYDETAGLPYYVDSEENEVFIGFAANGKYIAPDGVTVLIKQNTKSFSDTGLHWAKNYIDFVTERELFTGTANNTFSPDAGMTRAMFATVIGRLYERSFGEIEAAGTHSFTDCDYDDYYGKYVDWAAKEGVIGGYGNGKFGPNDQITREQMAAILYRFADFLDVLPADMGAELDYPDAGDISSWSQAAALYCRQTGIITGRDGGSFAPQDTATRAEVAVILERFIENVLD